MKKQYITGLFAMLFFMPMLSIAQQKPTKTSTDMKKTEDAIKAIGSLFKKKNAPAQPGTPQVAAPVSTGSDGTMPPLDSKIFQYPGGGFLFAENQSSIVLLNGLLYGWGDNSYGQSGNGKSNKTYLPGQITTDNDWAFLSCGPYYNLAIKTDGSLWAWGWGNTGELGLGNNYRVEYPARVGRDTNWVSVSAADGIAAAIKSNGTLWVWGNNVDEKLGIGPTLNSKAIVPAQLGKATDWAKAVAGDGYILALKKDNSLWAWGQNSRGALGAKTIYTVQQAPIRIGTDNDWAKIFAGTRGYGSFAIKANGTLWAWGYNRDGQLGIGKTAESYVPSQVGVDRDWLTIANQSVYTLGIKTDGSVWEWGKGKLAPQRLNVSGKYVAAAVGFSFSMLMKSDGTLWSRGNNYDGALGYVNDQYFNTDKFVQIREFPAPVITTKPKAVLSSVLNEDAALLFKQNKSKLSILDKNKAATLIGFKLSKDKKQFIMDAQSADYPFDVFVYPTDINKDGIEELFVLYGNTFTSGNTESNIMLLQKDSYGDWHKYLDFQGTIPWALPTGNLSYPDLVIGGPGFQFPVYRWNGKDYVMARKISDAELTRSKAVSVEILSKNLYKIK
jgi:alpha-tubulin suppressor-like RCC1 family protein